MHEDGGWVKNYVDITQNMTIKSKLTLGGECCRDEKQKQIITNDENWSELPMTQLTAGVYDDGGDNKRKKCWLRGSVCCGWESEWGQLKELLQITRPRWTAGTAELAGEHKSTCVLTHSRTDWWKGRVCVREWVNERVREAMRQALSAIIYLYRCIHKLNRCSRYRWCSGGDKHGAMGNHVIEWHLLGKSSTAISIGPAGDIHLLQQGGRHTFSTQSKNIIIIIITSSNRSFKRYMSLQLRNTFLDLALLCSYYFLF